jgi:hypothetical protein
VLLKNTPPIPIHRRHGHLSESRIRHKNRYFTHDRDKPCPRRPHVHPPLLLADEVQVCPDPHHSPTPCHYYTRAGGSSESATVTIPYRSPNQHGDNLNLTLSTSASLLLPSNKPGVSFHINRILRLLLSQLGFDPVEVPATHALPFTK